MSLYFLGLNISQTNSTNPYHKIIIRNGEKSRELKVEFADTDEERMKGLMNRTSLQGIDGMLFIFEIDDYQAFWMKNTLIPLDMIFFDSSKKFTNIHRNAEPCPKEQDICPSYPSEGKIKYVLETESGFLDSELINENTTFEIKE